jgi:hypothetical protein
LQVSKIQEDTQKRQGDLNTHTDIGFNGINTCFVTVMPPAATNDEETDIWKGPPAVPAPSYLPYSYLTFQNVITQFDSIATDTLLFTEQVGRCVEWWNMMKTGLETLKATLPKIVQGQPHSVRMLPDNAVDGWETVADQFALYVHKTSPVVKDYFTSPYIVGNPSTPYLGQYVAPAPYVSPAPYVAPTRRYRVSDTMLSWCSTISDRLRTCSSANVIFAREWQCIYNSLVVADFKFLG